MRSVVLLANLSFLASLAHAQVVSPTLRPTATLVTVPTLVQSPAGNLVTTLATTDFRLTDNTVEQRLSLDHLDRQPLAITVLLQVGGAAARQLPNYTGLATMLNAIVGTSPHRVSLITFDSRPEEAWDFTPAIDDLADGFLHPGPGDGGAAILDAVSLGIDTLQRQPPGTRRILLLISQRHDVGSQARLEQVVQSLGENNISIESLSFSPEKAWLKDQFTKPRHGNPSYRISPLSDPLIGTFDLGTPLGIALSALRSDTAAEAASLSGGESLQFATKADLESGLANLANTVHNRYALSFSPSSRQPGFHSLHVTVPNQPTLKVAARSGYWADAPPRPGKSTP